jgi:hypothetical protein
MVTVGLAQLAEHSTLSASAAINLLPRSSQLDITSPDCVLTCGSSQKHSSWRANVWLTLDPGTRDGLMSLDLGMGCLSQFVSVELIAELMHPIRANKTVLRLEVAQIDIGKDVFGFNSASNTMMKID